MAADLVGKALFSPKLLFTKKKEISQERIKEILIIRTAYIGDVMMTVPILKPLKNRFPDAKISFLTSIGAKEILENNPYIDELITYNPFWFYSSTKKKYLKFIKGLRGRIFDLVIEARGDIRELLFLVWPLKARYKVSYDVGGGGYFLTHVVPYNGLDHKVRYHLDMVRFLGCETSNIEWDVYLTEDEKVGIADILK